jgi:alkanesulfonate monooxygenase SsuD/methylene tetrahydromethanopterin reductase-like flavin-dependent oxidoreductase (luciferase family)
MKVGIQLLFQGRPDMSDEEVYKRELAIAVEGESMGFDMLLPVEHHFFDYAMVPDNAQLLSYIAGLTSKIQLMPAAFILPWNDPLRVVEKAILLDHLSGGRVIVGMGRGLAKREFDALRVPFGESRDRFDQAAEIVVRGLETGIVSGDTQYYKQPPIEIRPRPLKSFKDRVYMVGMSPQSVEMAGKLGLGCMKFSNAPWDVAAVDVERHRTIYREAHGHEAPPTITSDLLFVDNDVNRAEEMARKYMAGYYVQVMEHYELLSDNFAKAGGAYASYADTAKALRETDQQAVVDAYIECNLWGDPARIIDKLRERKEYIGSFDLAVSLGYAGMPYEEIYSSRKLFVEKVMPEIKSW